MSDENHRHVATWMAYGATAQAWGTTGKYSASRMIARVDLVRIAVNLSRFETVNMLVSHQQDLQEIKQLLAKVKHALNQNNHTVYTADNVFSTQKRLPEIEAGGKINLIVCPINDLWVRDTAPVFVKNASGKIGGVNFNFNG